MAEDADLVHHANQISDLITQFYFEEPDHPYLTGEKLLILQLVASNLLALICTEVDKEGRCTRSRVLTEIVRLARELAALNGVCDTQEAIH
jgi:hypothetical protein